MQGEGAWEIEAYADEGCKQSVAKVRTEDMGNCVGLGSTVARALIVRPAFNGGN